MFLVSFVIIPTPLRYKCCLYNNNMQIITRNRNEYRIPQHSTSFVQRVVQYKGIKAYESLSTEIEAVQEFKAF